MGQLIDHMNGTKSLWRQKLKEWWWRWLEWANRLTIWTKRSTEWKKNGQIIDSKICY
jgi:hypothetical protein